MLDRTDRFDARLGEIRETGTPDSARAFVERSDNPHSESRVARLQRALAAFRSSYAPGVLSAPKMINPLLDLWSVADAIDHTTAAPIERLLTSLVVRHTTTAAELSASVNEVEAVLARQSSR